MCRLALFNKKGIELIEKKYGAKQYFDFLEHSQGGHGNGIALIKDGKCKLLKKGLRLNNATIDKIIKTNDFDWAIYHTRIASIGNKKTKNCHPFRCNNNILAMNGTEEDFEFIANIQDITDTEAILRFAEKEEQNLIDVTSQLDSVFIGLCDGEVFATAGELSSYKFSVIKENDAIVFASEFPEIKGIMIKEPTIFPFCWIEGDELYLEEKQERMAIPSYWWNKKSTQVTRKCGWDRYFDDESLEIINNSSDLNINKLETKPKTKTTIKK